MLQMQYDLIDTEELARRTGTGVTTWAKRRMLGEPHSPPFLKLGRSVRYRWADVCAWMETRLRSSTSEPACPPSPGQTRDRRTNDAGRRRRSTSESPHAIPPPHPTPHDVANQRREI